MAQTPEERRGPRAERERRRRARLREAGIKVTRSDAYKEQHRQQERIRRATPEGKQYELEYRRKYRAANREQFRAYSRDFARRRRAKLKANGEIDPWNTPERQRQSRLRNPERYAGYARAKKYGFSWEDQQRLF